MPSAGPSTSAPESRSAQLADCPAPLAASTAVNGLRPVTRLSSSSGAAPTSAPTPSSAPARPVSSRHRNATSTTPVPITYGRTSGSTQTISPARNPHPVQRTSRRRGRPAARSYASSASAIPAAFISGYPPPAISWFFTIRSEPNASSAVTSSAYQWSPVRRSVSRQASRAKTAYRARVGRRNASVDGPVSAISGAARYASSVPMYAWP